MLEENIVEGTPFKTTDVIPPGSGIMRYMTNLGDTKHIWDADNPDEVAAARALFDDLVNKKKYAAFEVKADGEKGGRMKEFLPSAGKIILVAPMARG